MLDEGDHRTELPRVLSSADYQRAGKHQFGDGFKFLPLQERAIRDMASSHTVVKIDKGKTECCILLMLADKIYIDTWGIKDHCVSLLVVPCWSELNSTVARIEQAGLKVRYIEDGVNDPLEYDVLVLQQTANDFGQIHELTKQIRKSGECSAHVRRVIIEDAHYLQMSSISDNSIKDIPYAFMSSFLAPEATLMANMSIDSYNVVEDEDRQIRRVEMQVDVKESETDVTNNVMLYLGTLVLYNSLIIVDNDARVEHLIEFLDDLVPCIGIVGSSTQERREKANEIKEGLMDENVCVVATAKSLVGLDFEVEEVIIAYAVTSEISLLLATKMTDSLVYLCLVKDRNSDYQRKCLYSIMQEYLLLKASTCANEGSNYCSNCEAS